MFRRVKKLLARSKRPVLRQFADFTAADFIAHPVWIQCHIVDYDEAWYDDTDEETFRPWDGGLPAGPEEGTLLVRAKLTFSNSCILDGFLTPQHQGEPLDLGVVQPQLFAPSGRLLGFWDGAFRRNDEERHRFYLEVAADADSVFPVCFSADCALTTGQSQGSIPGFCCQPLGSDKIEVYT